MICELHLAMRQKALAKRKKVNKESARSEKGSLDTSIFKGYIPAVLRSVDINCNLCCV